MTNQWFVIVDGIVRGPMSAAELESSLSAWSQPLIWGRGLAEWVGPNSWKNQLESLGRQESTRVSTSVDSDRTWKLKIDGREYPPLPYESMLEALKSRDDLSDAWVWTEGYSDWREIFQVHQIADELGVSRRKHPRVPIMGTVDCESSERKYQLRALSISEGGLGASDGQNVQIGERLKIILRSPNLYGPIHASVEVVFAGLDGYVGMRFVGIQAESKSAIIEYVCKFEDEKTLIRS